jgi:HD superfamily phosphohydrolase
MVLSSTTKCEHWFLASVRQARGLLHDLSHGPFLHAAESLLPITGKTHCHDDYSIAAIKWAFPV